MISCAALVIKGLEEISAKEIEELIGTKCNIQNRIITFKAKKIEDLTKIAYKAQTINRVLYLIGEFKADLELAKCVENCKEVFKNFSAKKWIDSKSSFKVVCSRLGNHKYKSQELASEIGEFVKKKYNIKVDLENPALILFIAIIDNKGYLGVDISGFDLGKRQYKVFAISHAIKAPIAYAAIRLFEYKQKSSILDPFCGPGIIPIEAALFFNNTPVRKYQKDSFAFNKLKPFKNLRKDFGEEKSEKNVKIYAYDSEMPFVSAAKKNAKIAGVNKLIKFGRLDLEWLDTKFEKESMDAVITALTYKRQDKNTEKLYKELFYQCEYVIRKGGSLILVLDDVDKIKGAAEKHNFKFVRMLTIPRKQDFIYVALFSK